METLTLRELEPLASALLAVLLALMLARVTGEEPKLLQLPAQFRVKLEQRTGDAELCGSRLPRRAATHSGDENIELVGGFSCEQGLLHDRSRRLAREIVFKRT